MDLEKHWDNIFNTSNEDILGWFEKDFTQTKKFLEKIENIEYSTVFVSGAGVSKITDILAKREAKTILNDISKEALKTLESRIQNLNVEYFLHDISKPFEKECDLWMDRAVLHFLIEEEHIQQYFKNLKNSLSKNGYVLFAQYTKGTATKCATLPLHQYSIEEFQSRLGDEFSLICSENYEYTMPNGSDRLYIYALFKRDS